VRRRYAREEVDAIVKRAAELEASHPTSTMTLGGIEQVAAEVGIPAEHVRQAAHSIRRSRSQNAPAQTNHNRFIGGPTRIVFERVVDGELPDSEFLVVVDEIRRHFHDIGQVSQLGRSFAWTTTRAHSGVRRELEVVVTVRSGTTRIVVQERLANLIGGIFGGIGGGMGGGGLGPLMALMIEGMGVHPGFALGMFLPAWLTLTFATARTSYFYASRKRVKSLEAAADLLADVAQEIIENARVGLPSGPNPRRLK
jgi:hypothetical protein